MHDLELSLQWNYHFEFNFSDVDMVDEFRIDHNFNGLSDRYIFMPREWSMIASW